MVDLPAHLGLRGKQDILDKEAASGDQDPGSLTDKTLTVLKVMGCNPAGHQVEALTREGKILCGPGRGGQIGHSSLLRELAGLP
jgi:hypothetical protein